MPPSQHAPITPTKQAPLLAACLMMPLTGTISGSPSSSSTPAPPSTIVARRSPRLASASRLRVGGWVQVGAVPKGGHGVE